MTEPPSTPTSIPAVPTQSAAAVLRPAHLAAWVRGSDLHEDPLVVLDDELVGPQPSPSVSGAVRFDPRRWIESNRTRHPDLALALVYDGRDVGPGGAERAAVERGRDVWHERLTAVIDCLAGDSDGFTGDTTPTSLSRLRRWTDDTLRRGAVPPSAATDVVLLVDELASNVEEHAPGWMTVDMVFAEDHVIVVVSDPHPDRVPVVADPPPEQPNGRGLLVVSALAVRWGVVSGRTSKAVWAEVAWPVRPVADGDRAVDGASDRSDEPADRSGMVESGRRSADTGRAADGAVV